MEYIFSCEVCSEDYNNEAVIPKVLNCGHSFCSSCITKLNNSICPKCRASIERNREFPINYSIFNIIDECKSGKNLVPDIVCRIQDLRKKVNSTFKIIKSEISEKSKQQTIVERHLKILKSLEAKDLTQESTRNEVRKHLSDMEKRYEVPSIANPNAVIGVELVLSFSLKKSRSNDAFLNEIYQALKNFEKVFAFKSIDMKLKLGELTFRDNQIFIHSLSLDEPPKGSKTVPFDDLKEASRERTFDTFIEFTGKKGTSHTVIIDLQDNKLCPHFIKLCTGENGPSYRNCSYSTETKKEDDRRGGLFNPYSTGAKNVNVINPSKRQKRNGPITSALFVDISKNLPLDYYKNVPSNIQCFPNEVIVKERPNDGFELREIYSEYHYSIIGKVIYPLNILDYAIDDKSSPCKILDCGIAIEL